MGAWTPFWRPDRRARGFNALRIVRACAAVSGEERQLEEHDAAVPDHRRAAEDREHHLSTIGSSANEGNALGNRVADSATRDVRVSGWQAVAVVSVVVEDQPRVASRPVVST